ncbi:hypothetical protein D3C73_1445030 [compost metagenome]
MVGHCAYGADQHRVVAGPVVWGGALGLSGIGHCLLIPGPLAWVVIGQYLPCRPGDMPPIADSIGDVSVIGMGLAQMVEQVGHTPILIT